TLVNLANTYWSRHQDRPANLRRAERRYAAALAVFARDTHPRHWATTQSNLGLIRSDPAWPGGPDHESAIGHLTHALQIPELDTQARGTALLNLSLSYQRRIRGDITGNQDAALRYAAEAYDLFSALGSGPSTASAAAAIGDALGERLVRSGAADLSEAIGW